MKNQVFVSYAHADNAPMDDQDPGWVSNFVDKLQTSIRRHPGGESLQFWMDPRLEPQRQVDDELRKRVRESAVLLAFLSPRYLRSTWCTGEMATFVQEVGRGTAADRVFLVELLPTSREDWPQVASGLTPVVLWEQSLTRPEPKTKGWPVPDARGHQDYWDLVNSLAGVMARQLAALGAIEQPTQAPPALAPGGTAPVSIGAQPSAPEPATGGVLNIVVHAADDEDPQLVDDTRNLLDELDAGPFLVPGLSPGQTPADHRAAVEELVRKSDGVLVVYGAAPASWVVSKYSELRKLLALERKGTWAGILEGPPAAKPPHGLPRRGLIELDCRNGTQREELGRFVQALRQQQGTPSV